MSTAAFLLGTIPFSNFPAFRGPWRPLTQVPFPPSSGPAWAGRALSHPSALASASSPSLSRTLRSHKDPRDSVMPTWIIRDYLPISSFLVSSTEFPSSCKVTCSNSADLDSGVLGAGGRGPLLCLSHWVLGLRQVLLSRGRSPIMGNYLLFDSANYP